MATTNIVPALGKPRCNNTTRRAAVPPMVERTSSDITNSSLQARAHTHAGCRRREAAAACRGTKDDRACVVILDISGVQVTGLVYFPHPPTGAALRQLVLDSGKVGADVQFNIIHGIEVLQDTDIVKGGEMAAPLLLTLVKTHGPTYASEETLVQEQDCVNCEMRAILSDWLVDVHMKNRLGPETEPLFQLINLVDRYLGAFGKSAQLRPETLFLSMILVDRYLESRPNQRQDTLVVGVSAQSEAKAQRKAARAAVRAEIKAATKASRARLRKARSTGGRRVR